MRRRAVRLRCRHCAKLILGSSILGSCRCVNADFTVLPSPGESSRTACPEGIIMVVKEERGDVGERDAEGL